MKHITDDVTAQRTYEQVMIELLQGVSAPHTGAEFFRALVRQLAGVLDADAVLIGEAIRAEPGRIRTVAAFIDGQVRENFSYDLAGTPCAEALVSPVRVCAWPSGVRELFADDLLLVEMGVEGYAGIGLRSAAGLSLGVMAVLFRRPIPDWPLAEVLLQLFAARAGAEIERSQMQEELHRKEAKCQEDYFRLLQILEGVAEPICLISADYRVMWANQAHQTLFAATSSVGDRICYKGFGRHTPCDDCPLRHCLSSGQPHEQLKQLRGRTLGIKMFPLGKLAEYPESIIAFSSDITEKLQRRGDEERQVRLIALGELAAGVAHEINNPNALVLLNAPLLREVWEAVIPLLDQQAAGGDFPLGKLPYSRLRAEVPKLFNQLQHSAERIRAIVEELKSFVSPGERVEDTFDLAMVVRQAAEQVQAIHGGQTIEITGEQLPPVRGSATRLEQVFINLLTNALQALDAPGQKVRIDMRHLSEEGVNVVRIVDQGVGMAPEVLQRITDPFFTTRRNVGGLGLGLSVSARVVGDHDGRMHFASTPGQGTTVRVVLPVWTGGL